MKKVKRCTKKRRVKQAGKDVQHVKVMKDKYGM